ncbi:MAG: ABC transporter permease subunit [Actinobacteria bacterium]|nr:ABC transporter permease subunit [Actinomycetota bacterium]
MASATTVRPPLWRDIRVLRWVGQIIVAVAVIAFMLWIYNNVQTNLRRAGLPTGYGFLERPYGVDIPGSDFRPNQSIWQAFMVGYGNTIRVIAFGIPVCTILGILIGISRLSDNALVRAFGTVYVETFRNIPVLLWILLSFGPVLTLSLPVITEPLEPLGLAVFSNRGIFVPWFNFEVSIITVLVVIMIAMVTTALVVSWRGRVNEKTGRPSRGGLFGIVAFIAVILIGFFSLGTPTTGSVPSVEGRLVTGGINVFINYAALTLALTLYTASHVAEIVRGAIQAVHKGQGEAANALALNTYQRYRFVILPQAFRIMIPPLASQYLNLTKNSSLGVAIGFFEITRVYQTVANNAAPQIQAVTILMGLYLTFSLGISLIANIINRRLQLETR